jgi:hypothetical protein
MPLIVLICALNFRSMTITLERQLGHARLLRYLIITSVPALDWLCLIATSMPHNHPDALAYGFLRCRFYGWFFRKGKGQWGIVDADGTNFAPRTDNFVS